MKKKNLTDLEKARDHFIRATTESIVGAGFAIKGVRNLLGQREGRKLASDFALRFIKTGMDLMANPFDVLSSKKTKAQKPKPAGKRRGKLRLNNVFPDAENAENVLKRFKETHKRISPKKKALLYTISSY